MKELRFHGRGGQGVVTAASIFAGAAFLEGKYAQMIPIYGGARRGGSVTSFVRISDTPIKITQKVYEPDCVVVFDPKLSEVLDVTEGLKKDGMVVLNERPPFNPKKYKMELATIVTLDATSIAIDIFGRTAIPITNTAMLGALCKGTGWVDLDSLVSSINETFSGAIAEKNVDAVKIGYKKGEVLNINES